MVSAHARVLVIEHTEDFLGRHSVLVGALLVHETQNSLHLGQLFLFDNPGGPDFVLEHTILLLEVISGLLSLTEVADKLVKRNVTAAIVVQVMTDAEQIFFLLRLVKREQFVHKGLDRDGASLEVDSFTEDELGVLTQCLLDVVKDSFESIDAFPYMRRCLEVREPELDLLEH